MKTQKLTLASLALMILVSQVFLSSCSGSKMFSAVPVHQKRKFVKAVQAPVYLAGKTQSKEVAKKLLREQDSLSVVETAKQPLSDGTGELPDMQLPSTQHQARFCQPGRAQLKTKYSRETFAAASATAPQSSVLKKGNYKKATKAGDDPAPKRKMNRFAVAAFVCSILGLFIAPFIGSIVAIVFASIAMGQIQKHHDTTKGNGFAIAALTIGIIGFFISGLVLLFVLLLGSGGGIGFGC